MGRQRVWSNLQGIHLLKEDPSSSLDPVWDGRKIETCSGMWSQNQYFHSSGHVTCHWKVPGEDNGWHRAAAPHGSSQPVLRHLWAAAYSLCPQISFSGRKIPHIKPHTFQRSPGFNGTGGDRVGFLAGNRISCIFMFTFHSKAQNFTLTVYSAIAQTLPPAKF